MSRRTPKSSTVSSDVEMTDVDKEEEKQRKRLKEAEDKAGVSFGFFEEFFKLDGDPTAMLTNPSLNPLGNPNREWYADSVKKEEPEVKEEKKESKYRGKQYVTEVREKERQRIIKAQIEENRQKAELRQELYDSPEPSHASSQMSISGQSKRPQSRLRQFLSTQSLQSTASTDILSVGTAKPPAFPHTIEEGEDMSELISQYFSSDKPKRAALPITKYEETILSAIDINRVIIIEGATGCGKTTQVPQYIADHCAGQGLPFNIVVTQPRRIAAKSISARVAEERGWELGTIVGYQIGMDKSKVNEDTRLLYCTTGVLLQRLINTRKLDNYSHIIIDEVHERSIDTDLLLLVIKRLMSVQSVSVKIILMSATFEVPKLMDYFTIPIFNNEGQQINEFSPAHIKIIERPHKLSIFYLSSIKSGLNILDTPQYRDIREYQSAIIDKDIPCVSYEAMEVCVKILEEGLEGLDESSTKGSVLVFLPGLEEITELKARLEDKKDTSKPSKNWAIYPLHSSIPLDKQNEIFKRPLLTERKVILATNIAESSITVPDVTYVIDFCLTKTLVCDIETHFPVLRLEWASKANLDQRAGRAGRVSTGRVYRLVEEPFFRRLPDYNEPELVRAPLDLSILRVKMLDMGSPKELLGLALSPPDLADIYQSMLQLKQVGAFKIMTTDRETNRVYYDEEDGDITTLGVIISNLPIDIRLGKLVVMGHVFDCLEDCIIIAACLSTHGIFRKDFNEGLNAYKSRLSWADRSFSDAIALSNAYKIFKKYSVDFEGDRSGKLAESWCRQNFLQYKRLLEVDYMIGDLISRLAYSNIIPPNRPNRKRNRHEDELIVKVVMCAAFYPNFFTRNQIDIENIPKMLSAKDPLKTVAINGFPPNEGPLYANKIRQLFSTYCSKRIDLNFEDTKVYLTFLDDRHPLTDAFDRHVPSHLKREPSELSLSTIKSESRPSSSMSDTASMSSLSSSLTSLNRIRMGDAKDTLIKTSVYVALAMRGYRSIPKEVSRLHPSSLSELMKKLERVKEESMSEFRTFRSHRVAVPHVTPRYKLAKLPLPALDCSEIDIKITHIEDPSKFYAQYDHDFIRTHLEDLSFMINYECEFRNCHSETIKIGDIVIAPYYDDQGARMQGRGRIDNIEYKMGTKEVDRISVFYIDMGFNLTFDDLKEVSSVTSRNSTSFTGIPPLAFECSLSEVSPSAISCFDNRWSKRSIKCFNSLKKKSITARIYSVVNRVVRMEIFEGNKRDESFNDILVSIGLAEKITETQQSQLNHDHRRRACLDRNKTLSHSQDPLKLETFDKPGIFDPDDVIEFDVDSERNNLFRDSHEKIAIKGPHSPLECTFIGVNRKTAHKTVHVDKDSVNHIVLEPDYMSKTGRLLVSSSIGLSNNTNNITLRDTTLMPNIRGFASLVAMLFAPRVQLRADRERKEYVGAICGLGYDKRTFKGYDPDSDAEIIFDSDISRDDVIKVNIIRYNISTLLASLRSLQEYVAGSLATTQRKVRRNIIQLLDRRRRVIDCSKYQPSFKWFDLKEHSSTADKNEAQMNSELLPVCEQVQLVNFDWYEDITTNLDQLKQSQQNTDKQQKPTLVCKLCGFKSYSRPDIQIHLTSQQHLDRIIEFNKELKIRVQHKEREKYLRNNEMEDIEEGNEEIIDIFDEDSEED
ncbi:ATP-dependent RNA helicase TDRD9-like [Oppia nitens]|uniref:ATP-dependent RNA helicase TDRD9-like n=1 Tax=Oppia nitens TaxID=1686743 RepID=UPI0023DAB2CA|nr:ATP-dependent RNA helicase TDRD9-like [Oppia nitens]